MDSVFAWIILVIIGFSSGAWFVSKIDKELSKNKEDDKIDY